MDFKEKIVAASSFGIAVAASYLFGYWGAFNVNVLELGSLADIAKLATFPLLASLTFLLAGVFTSDVLQGDRLSPGGGNDTPIGRFGLKYWRAIVAIQIITITLIAIFSPEPGKWFAVAVLISLLSTPFSHSDAIIELIPDPKLRSKVLFLVLLLPPISFAYGRLDAYLVKGGHPPRIVDVGRSKLELREEQDKRVAYLGRVGEIDVLFESLTGSIVLLKQSDETPLFITPRYETALQGEVGKAKVEPPLAAASDPKKVSEPSESK